MNKTITLFRGNTFLGNSWLINVLASLWHHLTFLTPKMNVRTSLDAYIALSRGKNYVRQLFVIIIGTHLCHRSMRACLSIWVGMLDYDSCDSSEGFYWTH